MAVAAAEVEVIALQVVFVTILATTLAIDIPRVVI
jgi:hypothetical protein